MKTKVSEAEKAELLALSIEARKCMREGKPMPWHLYKDLVAAIVGMKRNYGVNTMHIVVDEMTEQCDKLVGKVE